MIDADDEVHRGGELRRSQRPAFFQEQVVDVLQAESGVLAEDIERVEHFLKVDQTDVPRALLLLDDRLQRIGGGAMAAAGVEKDEVNLLMDAAILAAGSL